MGFRWRRGRLGLGLGSRVQALASVNTTLWGALLLLGASSLAHEATCPLVCECPKPPACRPGVPLIQDGCGCCQVCAGQFNEMCSALRPCDRGLRCEQAAGSSADRGICRASTPGHPCTKNGKVYQHGESFRPNCRLQCTCEDGRVGCLALCPLHLPTPPVPCPDAHLVQVAGTCCKRWKCTTSYSKDWPQRDGKWKSRFDSVNEVVENRVAAKRSRGHFKARSFRGPGCTVKSTEWSQCSKTCSIGVSTRRSNNNTRCQLREEKRLCQTRPCAMLNDLAPKVRPEPALVRTARCHNRQRLPEDPQGEGAQAIYLRGVHQPEAVQAQVLRPVPGWPLLPAVRDQDHQGALPLPGSGDPRHTGGEDQEVRV
ncbi:CCN family member 1-like isoform X2 [Pristis pectinata]|uniref:CCN family member 1-like isoform X2 n=1 Tax=Pristis pectinata TaxID=685728 RepID=UPI00223DC03C|nr:CCN family member 1-like isoform X2 [Pristis pectinata]